MPGSDDYGQSVPWVDNGDSPDLRVGTKGIVDALTPRSVMRFADAAERNATILTPQAGMVAFLTAEKLFTGYDGSAWVVMAAGSQQWTTVSLASGWTHNGNNNGNFQYRLVNLFGADTLMFRGAIGRSSYPSSPPGDYVITGTPLPTTYQPLTLRTINVPCSDVSSERIALKLDIRTDGHLQIFGTGSSVKPPWIGFNGCFVSL